MGRKSYFAFVAALAAIFALTVAAPAQAGGGRGHGHGYGNGWKGGGGRYVQNNYYNRRGGGSNALAAGIIGLGVGAVIGSALTPKEVYVAPPRPPARPVGYRPQPWTEDWYIYCQSRYRSFNPRSGTYLGYDGYEHFCR